MPEGYLERNPLWDGPSEPCAGWTSVPHLPGVRVSLAALMNEALTRIMLVSDGAVMALRERTMGSKAGSADLTRRTAGKDEPMDLVGIVENLDRRFEKCKTHRQRLLVIRDTQRTDALLRYSPDRSMVRGTVEWREAVARDSRSCRVLAAVWGISKSEIGRIKKGGGR